MANTPVITMRLSPELTARVDAYAERVQKETGVEVTRSAAARALILAGLEMKEREMARK